MQLGNLVLQRLIYYKLETYFSWTNTITRSIGANINEMR
jgi:hypothetical protein